MSNNKLMSLLVLVLAFSVAEARFSKIKNLLDDVKGWDQLENSASLLEKAVLDKYSDFLDKTEGHKRFSNVKEFNHRLSNYKLSAQRIANHQKEERGTAVHGETKFADFSEEEFKQLFTGYKATPAHIRASVKPAGPAPVHAHNNLRQKRDIPTNFDWRTSGIVGAIKDQGQCGDCYAFASTGVMESVTALSCNKTVGSYSEQQILDCTSENYYNQGCDGGYTYYSYLYVQQLPGQTGETDYPYQEVQQSSCKLTSNMPLYDKYITSEFFVPANETSIAEYLVTYGPLSIAISSAQLQTYQSGILNPTEPSGGWVIDHANVIVGYGYDTASGLNYWIIRNSWGTSWGESGYYRLARGTNALGITTDVEGVTIACSAPTTPSPITSTTSIVPTTDSAEDCDGSTSIAPESTVNPLISTITPSNQCDCDLVKVVCQLAQAQNLSLPCCANI